jgi:hypothetical protein
MDKTHNNYIVKNNKEHFPYNNTEYYTKNNMELLKSKYYTELLMLKENK